MSTSLKPYGQEHARLPCPSPSPRVCSNSCPLSRWCHPTISSSVNPFSSCPQSFTSGSLSRSHLFASDEQNFGVSASAPVLPMNIQGWFPLGLTGLIPMLSKGLSTSITVGKHQSALSRLYDPALTSVLEYWKNCSFNYMDLCQQSPVMTDKWGFVVLVKSWVTDFA